MVQKMIESGYTTAVHGKLPDNMFHWKINDNFAGGVPDAFYMLQGEPASQSLWVEYKFIKALPKRGTTLIVADLSPQQVIWLQRLEDSGKLVRIVVGVANVRIGRTTGGIVMSLCEAVNGVLREGVEVKMLSYQGVGEEFARIMRHN
jgi:hypothetical protein